MTQSIATPIAAPIAAPADRRWLTLAVLSLSLIVIGLDNTVLNVALPTIQTVFSATSAELQWMVDAYVIVFAGLLLVMGALGDRFGRARALQTGLVIFGLASLAAAFSTTSSELILARATMGMGAALIMPATLSIIIHVFPPQERARAIAIWAGVAGVGIGLGPLVGGLLLEQFSWGSVFLINLPIVLVALVAGAVLVPESRDPSPARLDWQGAVLSVAGISVLVFGLIEAPSRGWTDPQVLGVCLGGLLLLVGFVWRQLTSDHALLDMGLFRDLHFSIAAAAIAFAFFTLFGMIFMLTQYLQLVHGLSALEAGLMMLPLVIGLPVGAAVSVRLGARFGARATIGGALIALACLLASMSQWQPETELWVVALTLLLGAGIMANVMAPATESVMGSVPDERAGVGSATNDVVRELAGALAIAILGSSLATIYGDRMADAVARLPPDLAAVAQDSVGAALAIAGQLGGAGGAALADAARTAFMGGMSVSLVVAAAVAMTGAGIVLRFLPRARV